MAAPSARSSGRLTMRATRRPAAAPRPDSAQASTTSVVMTQLRSSHGSIGIAVSGRMRRRSRPARLGLNATKEKTFRTKARR
jgi:hypothetical protein